MPIFSRWSSRIKRTISRKLPIQRQGTTRRLLHEMLEARHMLSASGFPGNDCAPDLDLSAVSEQTVTVGQVLTLNVLSAGGTVEDLTTAGDPTGDTIHLYLDPDVGTDTPEGATITEDGTFSWTPSSSQVGTHTIIVIAVDSGTPALADSETFSVVVVAEDQPPIIDLNGPDAGTGFEATFVEDGGPVSIVDSDLTVTDADDAELQSATVTLTNHPNDANETLTVDTTGTSIASSYSAATGVLSLTGPDTAENFQQVLRTVTYQNLSQAPDTTDRIVEFVASDGTSSSVTATATITIQPVNDAPNVDLNGGGAGTGFTATFTEDGGPVAIVGTTATLADVDNTSLSSATATITNLLDGAAELLSVDTGATALTAAYDTGTGVLTLTGTDSLANYQQVLRTLTYDNSSQNPSASDRTVEEAVNDGTDASTPRIATVSIIPVNDQPDMAPIVDTTAVVDLPFTQTVTATDPDDDLLTYQLDRDDPNGSIPASATITKISNNEAEISWTPSAGDGPGPFTFVVLVTDDDAVALSDREEFVVTLSTAAPVVDLNGTDEVGVDFAALFVEDGGAVAIVDTDLAVTDFDSSMISSATVTITNLQDGADEVLTADTAGTSIISTYDSGTGVLSLTGASTLENYQQVLRTLQYDNASQNPGVVDRSVTVVVNDSGNDSAVATTTISVTGVNDAVNLTLPAPYDDGSTPVEVTLGDSFSFTATAEDPDDLPSQITYFLDLDGSGIAESAAQPTITSPPDDVPGGLFQWTPDALGTFSITVVVTDSNGLPDQETFVITVVSASSSSLTAGPQTEDSRSVDELDAAFASLV